MVENKPVVERTVVKRTVVERTVVERTVVETTSGGKHTSRGCLELSGEIREFVKFTEYVLTYYII